MTDQVLVELLFRIAEAMERQASAIERVAVASETQVEVQKATSAYLAERDRKMMRHAGFGDENAN